MREDLRNRIDLVVDLVACKSQGNLFARREQTVMS